jgi:hypothetical protein
VASNGGARHQKSGKASFEHVYDREDPREYFRTLGVMDYRIPPHHGQRLFSTLVEGQRDGAGNGRRSGEPFTVVDLCCSYGINGALLKYDVTLDDLYERYGSQELDVLSPEELAVADREFYGERRSEDALRVVGLDLAENAVSYGLRAGLLDDGVIENLEEREPTDRLREAVSGMDLLTVTGGIGYISERTFDQLLGCLPGDRVLWVATFALRWVSYDAIAGVLSRYGLATERLESHTFDQRRFRDVAEQEYVCGELESMGIDPEGKESEGSYHAHFHLSRPAGSSEASVEELFEPVLR